jgi:ribosomal protein S18 acetylase RimI-like enzyme
MNIRVDYYDDAGAFLADAGAFLRSSPVHHNLILTLLEARISHPEPGRYWLAARQSQVAGVVLQTPFTRPALLVPMEGAVMEAIVDAIAEAGVILPGVNGDAAAAASFAGRWSERHKSGAFPSQGFRLYELAGLNPARPVDGALRQATAPDRELVLAWTRAFNEEIHEPANDDEARVDKWIATRRAWLWRDGAAVSMAVGSQPVEGVVRVSGVYTPPENRGRGYAEACVHGISRHFSQAGYRCVLYTDLGNPTSNSIYRRIGYKAVSEALHYRFEAASS